MSIFEQEVIIITGLAILSFIYGMLRLGVAFAAILFLDLLCGTVLTLGAIVCIVHLGRLNSAGGGI
ncbi:MAG: hypothetical protein ACP5GI_03195 [Sulfolobales archaeon]